MFPLAIVLVVICCVCSFVALRNDAIMDRFAFSISAIKGGSEYYRLITSGFLHVSWLHLFVNMLVLFVFGTSMEQIVGPLLFIMIFFASLIGGNLLALLTHWNSDDYSSVGASGAVSGLVFGYIALYPFQPISLLVPIPGWVYGVLYVLYTVYAIRMQKTDVGHAAHLGGALVGMAVALVAYPNAILQNVGPILLISVPAIALILVMIYKPNLILIDKKEQRRHLTKEDLYNEQRLSQSARLDRILEKINHRGMKSLTKAERDFLDQYSK